MPFWQVVGNRRYLRTFFANGCAWTAVLSWHSEQGNRTTAPDACWLLRLGPGAPRDLDRSLPIPPYLVGDAEAMEAQHALRTAERYVEAELDDRFEPLTP